MNFVQANKFKLAGSGCTSTATSIALTSMKLPDGSTNISMTDFGTIGYATIEPGTSKEEQISFTGISIDEDTDVATLTGVSRGLRFVSPYDVVAANKKSHAGGAIVILTNTAGFYGQIKDYIDNLSIAGSVPATPTVQGIVYLPVIETTTGTTHSLTTVAGEKVIVWAKGRVDVNNIGTQLYLKYNGVQKDEVFCKGDATGHQIPFSMMYTETPGAGTQDITVEGSSASVVIIVLKLRQN